MMHPGMPLGAQLIPILVHEPYLPNEQVWCTVWFRGIWLCGNSAWKRLAKRSTAVA